MNIVASIIITTYQRPKTIIRAIDSVLNQTFNCVEIIVVDDNAINTSFQKETERIIRSFYKEDIIKYVKLKYNVGACSARNIGAEIATGKYLFFLDDDDVFLPEKVETQIKFLKMHPEYDGNVAAFIRLDDNGNEIYSQENFPRIDDFKKFVYNGNFFTPMLCIKKESFLKIGGFTDIPRFQDRFFMLKALKLGLKFEIINKPLHIMHEHNSHRITHASINTTFKSLDIIKDYIIKYKNDFTKIEWRKYELNDCKIRANVLYNSNYLNRLKSIKYWFKCFFKCPKKYFIIMLIKSLILLNSRSKQ